jgi:hypothetical protein
MSGTVPLHTVMTRLLTGHAVVFNKRHHHHGQLFQNRYKSTLCREDAYLAELVCYIHLNPIRAGIINDLTDLSRYPYSGHAALMGRALHSWQDADSSFVGRPPDPASSTILIDAGITVVPLCARNSVKTVVSDIFYCFYPLFTLFSVHFSLTASPPLPSYSLLLQGISDGGCTKVHDSARF